ncbi:transglutaminase family protein [Cellulomonas alba]|uniref:Transglutaminase family protein n=1 Tax=Cellulomonas alba TaxID=3053467 RepID=A0ABT7SDX8_9CELL|nr:transglutaminase family protein [Cellulomonas alba]MDM7853787.1 transglutaminase family protein [Cellulomonas alba]
MRLKVVHTSAFRYDAPVVASYNEARMTPVSDAAQRVLSTRIDLTPHTWTTGFVDYWGTAVTAFEVLAPHEALVITAEHLVEVGDRHLADDPVGWDVLRSPRVRDEQAEFLTDLPTTAVPEAVADLARQAAGDLPPHEAAVAACDALRDAVAYIPGVTTAHTPAAEAWEARAGVCQDLAHLAVGALHALGIPARYVSGYLHPQPDADVGETVVGESHAWVEWWVGAWTGYDPTNRVPVGEHHVMLARARSYDDVPPLRGIYAGTGTSDLTVEVRMTRVA